MTDATVLVTGANRGLGQALVEEALRRGAKRVYAATRQAFTHPDERVEQLALDVTDPAQIQAAADQVGSLDLLFNNAAVSLPDDLSDRTALERHLAVNLFGTYDVTQAFLPLLIRSSGAIVNNRLRLGVALAGERDSGRAPARRLTASGRRPRPPSSRSASRARRTAAREEPGRSTRA